MVSTSQHLQLNMVCKIKCFLQTGMQILLEMRMLMSAILFFSIFKVIFHVFKKLHSLEVDFIFYLPINPKSEGSSSPKVT